MGVPFIFTQRSAGYKIGLVLVLLSVVCYLVGFSSPHWTVYRASYKKSAGGDGDKNIRDPYYIANRRGHNGLWETCSIVHEFSARMCAAISHHRGYPAWMSGVQGLQSVGLTSLLVASLYAGGINFMLRKPLNNRYLETLLLLSGTLGFTGTTIYAAESYGNDQILMVAEDAPYYSDDNGTGHDMDTGQEDKLVVDRNELAWAFAVNLTGSLLAILAAVLIFAQNRYIPEENLSSSVAGVSFSAAAAAAVAAASVSRGTSHGGAVVFVPPEHLVAGGFSPPPYSPRDSIQVVVESQQGDGGAVVVESQHGDGGAVVVGRDSSEGSEGSSTDTLSVSQQEEEEEEEGEEGAVSV